MATGPRLPTLSQSSQSNPAEKSASAVADASGWEQKSASAVAEAAEGGGKDAQAQIRQFYLNPELRLLEAKKSASAVAEEASAVADAAPRPVPALSPPLGRDAAPHPAQRVLRFWITGFTPRESLSRRRKKLQAAFLDRCLWNKVGDATRDHTRYISSTAYRLGYSVEETDRWILEYQQRWVDEERENHLRWVAERRAAREAADAAHA